MTDNPLVEGGENDEVGESGGFAVDIDIDNDIADDREDEDADSMGCCDNGEVMYLSSGWPNEIGSWLAEAV